MRKVEYSRRTFFQRSAAAASAAYWLSGFKSPMEAADTPFVAANETIQQARKVALSVLQPKEADLARGLELHANSLVFDAYGFAPRGAIDAAIINEAVQLGATDAELLDLREELPMTTPARHETERREFLEAFLAAGVTCIFQNAGEEGSDPLRLIKRLARFTFLTDTLKDDCSKALTPADVVAAKKARQTCLAFTMNGVPLTMNWESVRDELRYVRVFQQLGVQMMHLTYNRRNPLGDGAGESNDGGLSDFGHTAVAEMNRLGIIVDVAHSGWRTSLEAAKASRKPMVASHTTCAGLYRHFRGKPDETITAICDTGGYIGMCCIPKFLGGKGDLNAFLDHLDYAIQKFGAEHVAIGTDIAYVSRNSAAEQAKIVKRPDGRSVFAGSGARWEHLWPADPFQPADNATQSLAWTNWPLYTVGMVQRGHSEETIRKVLGENVLRVWGANRG